MELKHRNSQKRIYCRDAIYFVTTNTKNWHSYFKESIFCEVFVENLEICKKLKVFHLYAWVLLHNHFHLLIHPSDEFNYSKIIHCLKRNVCRDINKIIQYSAGEDPNLRRYQPTNHQIIGEHMDVRLREWKTDFYNKYKNRNPFPQFRWQHSFNDKIIRNDNDLGNYWDYIAWNPIKHKMPENWPYVFTNPKFYNLIDEIEL